MIETGVSAGEQEEISVEKYRRDTKKNFLSVFVTLGFGTGAIVILWQNLQIAGRGDSNLAHDFLLFIVLVIVLGLICRNFIKLWKELDRIRNQIDEILKRTPE